MEENQQIEESEMIRLSIIRQNKSLSGGVCMKSILRIFLICMLALIFCTAAAGESVSLPGNLLEIQEEAFADCENLSGVLVKH